MEINADWVRSERQRRGWTQQHLADAAGLSLRTVQRIEKQGLASNESVSAMCAVFEVERSELLCEGSDRGTGGKHRIGAMVAAAATVGAAAGALMTWLLMSAAGAS